MPCIGNVSTTWSRNVVCTCVTSLKHDVIHWTQKGAGVKVKQEVRVKTTNYQLSKSLPQSSSSSSRFTAIKCKTKFWNCKLHRNTLHQIEWMLLLPLLQMKVLFFCKAKHCVTEKLLLWRYISTGYHQKHFVHDDFFPSS